MAESNDAFMAREPEGPRSDSGRVNIIIDEGVRVIHELRTHFFHFLNRRALVVGRDSAQPCVAINMKTTTSLQGTCTPCRGTHAGIFLVNQYSSAFHTTPIISLGTASFRLHLTLSYPKAGNMTSMTQWLNWEWICMRLQSIVNVHSKAAMTSYCGTFT
jgi:hypothetical protein